MPIYRLPNGNAALLDIGPPAKFEAQSRTAWAVRMMVLVGIAPPVCEYRFHPGRKFRFDFAWPDKQVALEIDGGVWTGGRHVRPAGFLRDREKQNLAAATGWRVLYTNWADVHTIDFLDLLADALRA